MGESDGLLDFGNWEDEKANPKPLHELIFSEVFTIDDVISTFQPTLVSSRTEMVIGGKSGSYNGGFTTNTVLDVIPQDASLPIRRLVFFGFSILKTGDMISAQIPRYTKHEVPGNFGHGGLLDWKRYSSFYTGRDYRFNETAIELNLLDPNGKSLRTERSVDYDSFHKK